MHWFQTLLMGQMCITSDAKIADEIKLKELDVLNLPRVWKEIYQVTGADLFIKIWLIISTPEYSDKNTVYVPSVKKYYMLQQALFIKTLIHQGASNTEICAELKKQGIQTSRTRVERLRKKFNLDNVNPD